ncbi:MAG: ABC transporter ATP-binding protein/permease [Prevotella sp.]|nr:ABC transporter ATP-binding protein/permease [Staphylococcus sp.]MCM1350044.1 ABC transporter ATP-binding protein/permease [Prevotella sp.]
MLKHLWKRLSKYTGWIILILGLALINVMATLYIPVLVGDAVDNIVDKGAVYFESLYPILLQMAICIVIGNIFGYLYEYIMSVVSEGMVLDLRKETFSKITHLPLAYVDSHRHGDIVSLLISDIEQVSNGLLQGFKQLYRGVIMIVATLVFMFIIKWEVALIVVLVTPLSLFVAAFISKKSHQYFVKQAKAKGVLNGYILEMVTNQKKVKSLCYEEQAIQSFEKMNQELYDVGIHAQFVSSTTNPCTRFVNGLVYALVGIVGAILVIEDPTKLFTVGKLSSFLTYANQYTKPFNEISGVISEVQSAFASYKRVENVLAEPNEIDEGTQYIALPVDRVEFRHVAFSYIPEKPLITDFNLTIEKGQKVAIVGPTGCGKTTMINLLLRYYDPVSGGIYIDGENTLHIQKENLRKTYGLVLQDTWIFKGTVFENIAYAKPDATKDEVIQAAKLAHADSFIRRLPQGYDTMINATSGLSQGEKQLITIARLMMMVPDVVILDEATSSIDTRTEKKIVEAFNYMMNGRTSFVIAHRLSTIREADMIIVMNKGNIVEVGNHQTLLAQKGFYEKLYHQGIVDN